MTASKQKYPNIKYNMKGQQNKNHPKIVHNIIWHKWQKKKAYYQQERTQQSQKSSLKNKFITEPISDEIGQPAFKLKYHRSSFNQFVQRVGLENNNVCDVGWVRVGQPHSYYVSYNKKRVKTVNSSTVQTSNESRMKMIHSRGSYISHRIATQPISEIRSKKIKSALETPVHQPSYSPKSNGFVGTVPRITKKRKNSGFQFRPWSGQKQSIIDYLVNFNK